MPLVLELVLRRQDVHRPVPVPGQQNVWHPAQPGCIRSVRLHDVEGDREPRAPAPRPPRVHRDETGSEGVLPNVLGGTH
eukprot:3157506-Pyramimonas_sp.AAC.1